MVLYLYDKTDFGRLGDTKLANLFQAITGADIFMVYISGSSFIVLIYTLLSYLNFGDRIQ